MHGDHSDKSKKHWETRPEPNWEKFKFNQPYAKGLARLRDEVLSDTNFDPATLWQWGTMQAMAVLEILKTMEGRFGREGQAAVFDALRRVGRDVGEQILAGTDLPEGMTETEWISFYATVVNRIAYASLETPEIQAEGRASFHIDWCPHQDAYRAFDCRIQRYLVQGMIEAALDHARAHGREGVWDVAFRATIPSGSQTCLFEILKDIGDGGQWAEYTRILEEKALEVAGRKRDRKTVAQASGGKEDGMTTQAPNPPNAARERDPDIAGAEAALIRAGKRARDRARQAGVPVVVVRDGKIVEEWPEDEESSSV